MRKAYCAFVLALAFSIGLITPIDALAGPAVVAQAQAAIISGVVRDTRGVAQGDALVVVAGPHGSQTARTAADGTFSFHVDAGVYSLSIDKGGFQAFRADVIAADGTTNNAVYPLADATTSGLRVIGSTSTTSSRVTTPINRDITAQASIGTDELISNPTPDLTSVLTDLPGVSLVQGNRSTLAYFNIRGSTGIEARTEIDGHPLSTGVSGVYYMGLFNGGAFQSASVEKGPGVSSADAGESSFGTLNLRTWDFSDTNNALFSQGITSYNGLFTQVLLRNSVLPNKRLSYVFNYNVTGYNGPAFGYNGPLAAPSGNSFTPAYTIGTTGVGSALINYNGGFDSGKKTESEVFKLRYRLSDTTSLWAGYVGSQGFVDPEGDLYGYSYGLYTIAPCFNGSTPQKSFATCNQTSKYNNPIAQPYIGKTIPLYSAYPDETQTENNPMFEAELRTSFHDDTILVRPFTQVVERINDGTQSPGVPGNNGAFTLATAPGSCTAANPCYINNGGALDKFTSANNPCATSNAPIANSCYQNGVAAPFYQFEVDRLHGVTATILHPLGKLGELRGSYEYTSDYTYDISGALPTQAQPLQVAGYPPFSQSISDVSNQSVPGAVRRSNDLSLTAFLTPSEKLTVAAGAFYNLDSLEFEYENPSILALAPFSPGGSANLPLDLVTGTINKAHIDPHLGVVYNANRNIAVRLAAGSSVTLPYAQQVSGFPTFTQPTNAQPFGYYTQKNPGLTPETVVSYDAGMDFRVHDGAVFTLDGFQNTIHNAFLTEFAYPNGQNAPAIKTTINAANYQSYGLELGFNRDTRLGFGYNSQLTLMRAFYYDLGPAYYSSNAGAYVTTFDNRQPDGTPFAMAHAALVWNGKQELRAEVGGNYTGNNNSFYVPGFVTFYGSVRRRIFNHTYLQVSARNILSENNLTGIAKATPFGTGISTVECKFVPSPGNAKNYVPSTCSNYTNGQQQIEPQTFGLALQYRF